MWCLANAEENDDNSNVTVVMMMVLATTATTIMTVKDVVEGCFAASYLCSKVSPTYMFMWPRCNHVKISCNTTGHMQHNQQQPKH